MTVVVSMLRGINLGRRQIKMEALRALYTSIGLSDAQTYIQSGNVVFRTKERNLVQLTRRIEDEIERCFGFRVNVIARSCSELRNAIARNPFASGPAIDPRKLLFVFLANEPDAGARDNVLRIKAEPEELRIDGRELYIYFPNGMARPKLSMAAVEKALKTSWTGRNWNTVLKLLELAERLEVLR